jgi:hypothetical protein
MKTIRLLVAFIGFALISINTYAQEAVKNDTVVMVGKIVKEQFIHGKPVEGVYDYFFRSNGKKYFIKTYKAKYPKEELEKWLDQSVEVKAVIVKQGSWDDNGEGQSRGGEHILLLSLKKE